MRAYINDEGLHTITLPRLPRMVQQPKIVNIGAIVDEIVVSTNPPKRYQKLVLNLTMSDNVVAAFEAYIIKMMIDSGWKNGNSEFVNVKEFWTTTHTVRQVDKDGKLCIGWCDGKGHKFVRKLKRNGWIDSFIACYIGAEHPESNVFFLHRLPPTEYRILDWWESNKFKFKQGLVALSKVRPFKMSEKSVFWWLRNRKWSLFYFSVLSTLIIVLVGVIVGLVFGTIALRESVDRPSLVTLLIAIVGFVWHWLLRPVWRKITAETPIAWNNGTAHDGADKEKIDAFFDSQRELKIAR